MERMGRTSVGAALLLVLVQGLTLSPIANSSALDHRPVAPTASDEDQQAPTTYQKFLPRALANEPDIQYLLGFMFLHGEGVESDHDQAHQWLHLAAESGHKVAQRLLGSFHAGRLARVPAYYHDPGEARHWYNRVMPTAASPGAGAPSGGLVQGEAVYMDYCAACHGVDGNALFPGAPSFAKGQRLDKGTDELTDSIVNGKGLMPPWGQALPAELAVSALPYIQARWAQAAPPLEQVRHSDELTREVRQGEKLFSSFCAGCHGLNGIAYYVDSPSFALGERLEKSDGELIRSINKGIGEMPNWDDKLTEGDVQALITFIRSLAPAFEVGLSGEVRHAEGPYFVFKTSKGKSAQSQPDAPAAKETAAQSSSYH